MTTPDAGMRARYWASRRWRKDLEMAREGLRSMRQGPWWYGHQHSCARTVASPIRLCGSGLLRSLRRCLEVASLPLESATVHAQCL